MNGADAEWARSWEVIEGGAEVMGLHSTCKNACNNRE